MRGRYRLSPAARGDLDEIWNYSAECWDAGQADSYILGLIGAIEKLTSGKRRGHACDGIRPGYFKYPYQSHVIFYKIARETVDIIRILRR